MILSLFLQLYQTFLYLCGSFLQEATIKDSQDYALTKRGNYNLLKFISKVPAL